jgi:hypothetical protein
MSEGHQKPPFGLPVPPAGLTILIGQDQCSLVLDQGAMNNADLWRGTMKRAAIRFTQRRKGGMRNANSPARCLCVIMRNMWQDLRCKGYLALSLFVQSA